MNYGVDRYKRPQPVAADEEIRRQKERQEYVQRNLNDLWRTIPKAKREVEEDADLRFPAEPQENILYFIEKNAPLLEPWQREIVRIIRKLAQYFYPQRQTQVMNEGWATFWHYTLLNQLYEEGLVSDAFMFEFLQSHTSVLTQLPFDHPGYSGINPYALGFAIFSDIRRICEQPTQEDREWFPEFAGGDWLETAHYAMQHFKDESFVQQFLSPKVLRDMKLFSILDDDQLKNYRVTAIHNQSGYSELRQLLASQYNLGDREPDIQVERVDIRGDRSMVLRHHQYNRQPLHDSTAEVLKHLHRLWGFPVKLESSEDGKIVSTRTCP